MDIYPQNKEEICRFCLKTQDCVANLLFVKEMGTELHESLKSVNLIVTYDEMLPNSICIECKNQIDRFFDFKNLIIQNETLLRNAYAANESEVKDDSFSDLFDNYQPNIIEDEEEKPIKKTRTRKKETVKCEFCNKRLNKEYIKKHDLVCKKAKEKRADEENVKIEEDKLYTCNICNSEFNSEVRMSLHYIQHVMYDNDEKIDPFSFCNHCGFIVNNNEEYQAHIKEKHDKVPNTWVCKICKSEFESEFLLMQHVHCNTTCRMLAMDFSSEICLLCRKDVNESLASHVKTHLLKRYSCKICTEKYITCIGYNTHLRKHPQYKYKCEYCCRMFMSKKNISKHTKEIHNSDQFICEICSKIFNRKHNLTLHKRQKHDEKIKNFICSLCAYATRSNSELRKHERLHSNERPFKCTFDKCNKSYKTSSHLSHHIKTHLNIRNFLCGYCDKSFYTSKNLKHHILAHTGVRDFKCTLCEQTFKRRDQLTAHMKKRHGCI